MRYWVLTFLFLVPIARGADEVTPAFVYRVPPLIDSMAKLAKEQAAVSRSINLKATDGSRILIKNVRYVEPREDNGRTINMLREPSFNELQSINMALKAAIETGSISSKLFEYEGSLYYNEKQLSLSFEVQKDFGQSTPVQDNKVWMDSFIKQFRSVVFAARLEDLSTVSRKDLVFGFVIGGKRIEDKDESKAISEKFKAFFSGDEIPEEISADASLKVLYRVSDVDEPAEVKFSFYTLDPITRAAGALTTEESREVYYKYSRHVAEVLKRRPERREKLTPLPFEKLTGPEVVNVDPGKPLYSPELKEADKYVAGIPHWKVLMDFFWTVSPPVHRRLEEELKTTKLRLEPVDTFDHVELKVTNPHRILDKELVKREGKVIALANNLYGKKNGVEKSYLILYGLLLGIEGLSHEGTFDFTCTIKMITQYEKKKEISNAEFEKYVFKMLTTPEIEDTKTWKRTIALTRQSPLANPEKVSAAGTAVTDDLKALEKKLEDLIFEQTAPQFEKIFGELPKSIR